MNTRGDDNSDDGNLSTDYPLEGPDFRLQCGRDIALENASLHQGVAFENVSSRQDVVVLESVYLREGYQTACWYTQSRLYLPFDQLYDQCDSSSRSNRTFISLKWDSCQAIRVISFFCRRDLRIPTYFYLMCNDSSVGGISESRLFPE